LIRNAQCRPVETLFAPNFLPYPLTHKPHNENPLSSEYSGQFMILSRKIIFQTFLEYILQLLKEVFLLKLENPYSIIEYF